MKAIEFAQKSVNRPKRQSKVLYYDTSYEYKDL
jgi:hypothetical protein